jgi:hypothetical protein
VKHVFACVGEAAYNQKIAGCKYLM